MNPLKISNKKGAIKNSKTILLKGKKGAVTREHEHTTRSVSFLLLNKKGVEMTLNTIVILIILVIVLIVMIYFFSKYYGSNANNLNDIGDNAINVSRNFT